MKQIVKIDFNRLAVEKCVEYIMASEEDDFIENPSRNHVYFWAYLLTYGHSEAEEMLAGAEAP